jgi:transcriptional regulator GlxA family with amidase domain
MEANLVRSLPISDLAREAGLSSSRFAHLFRAETGSTPARMIVRMRLTRAAELLTATRLPLKEIAVRVGFADSGTLGRAFRAWCGIPPSKFRRKSPLALLTGIAEFVK